MSSNKSLRFIRLPEVLEKTGLKTTRIHELETAGKFPRRVKISDRASGWLEHEVNKWMEQRIAASRSGGSQPLDEQIVATTNPEESPCEGCRFRRKCEIEKMACERFTLFIRGAGRTSWITAPFAPTAARYGALFG